MPTKTKKFCVPIVYSGLSNFIVEAESEADAVELARAKFNNGETPELLGNESENIESIDIDSIQEAASEGFYFTVDKDGFVDSTSDTVEDNELLTEAWKAEILSRRA